MSTASSLDSAAELDSAAGSVRFHRIDRVSELGLGAVDRLPVSLKVLLEGSLRRLGEGLATEADVAALAGWPSSIEPGRSVSFRPDRLILQDFTGLPALIGLAAMRSALHRAGTDPSVVDPVVPTVLVMDHSLQVDVAGTPGALAVNLAIEYERNAERYRFARWAEQAFANLRVVPPGKGIVHQVNMEFLASVVAVSGGPSGPVAHPDTLVGTDSHTTMVNSMGVLGWGVGGIEAEAVMLGEPIGVVVPEVVGVRLAGAPQPGVHRNRPGAGHHPDAAGLRCGGLLRRVLRPRGGQPPAARSGHHRQHGARVRSHRRLLRGRRRDAPLPPQHRQASRPHRPRRAVLPGPGHVPDAGVARAGLHQGPRRRPGCRRAGGGRAPPPPPDADALRGSRLVPPGADRASRAGRPAQADRHPK